MTRLGAVIFTDITGELAEAVITDRYYPGVSAIGTTLVWGTWRKPSHAELVEIWPSRRAPDTLELARGWWQATLEEARQSRPEQNLGHPQEMVMACPLRNL
jgi:hypothetical protein